MNLPSTAIRLEVATLDHGHGFVVQWDVSRGAGSVTENGTLHIRSREELQAWFANMEVKIK
jgi:hypothetical protein